LALSLSFGPAGAGWSISTDFEPTTIPDMEKMKSPEFYGSAGCNSIMTLSLSRKKSNNATV
jgi:hypothetical protein